LLHAVLIAWFAINIAIQRNLVQVACRAIGENQIIAANVNLKIVSKIKVLHIATNVRSFPANKSKSLRKAITNDMMQVLFKTASPLRILG
jgi:hypothetical protein